MAGDHEEYGIDQHSLAGVRELARWSAEDLLTSPEGKHGVVRLLSTTNLGWSRTVAEGWFNSTCPHVNLTIQILAQEGDGVARGSLCYWACIAVLAILAGFAFKGRP